MKRAWIFAGACFVVLLGAAVAHSQGKRSKGGEPARYQITTVEVDTLYRGKAPGTSSSHPERVVMMLDTSTGNTWRLISAFSAAEREIAFGWDPVGEFEGLSAQPQATP